MKLFFRRCLTCRKRKTRCDGKKPLCTTCTDNGHECLGYADQGEGPPKREIKSEDVLGRENNDGEERSEERSEGHSNQPLFEGRRDRPRTYSNESPDLKMSDLRQHHYFEANAQSSGTRDTGQQKQLNPNYTDFRDIPAFSDEGTSAGKWQSEKIFGLN